MEYILMLYADESSWSRMTPAEQETGMAAYTAYTQALIQASVRTGGSRLQDSDAATTVRMVDGHAQVMDGPFADSKEQIGGYYLIDVPDLDAALSWAARCPTASHGVVEVRPLWAAQG